LHAYEYTVAKNKLMIELNVNFLVFHWPTSNCWFV